MLGYAGRLLEMLDVALNEADIERLWIQFHRIWVAASDEVRAAEDRLHAMRLRHQQRLGPAPAAAELERLRQLRDRELYCRTLLEDFEVRQRKWRAKLLAEPNIP